MLISVLRWHTNFSRTTQFPIRVMQRLFMLPLVISSLSLLVSALCLHDSASRALCSRKKWNTVPLRIRDTSLYLTKRSMDEKWGRSNDDGDIGSSDYVDDTISDEEDSDNTIQALDDYLEEDDRINVVIDNSVNTKLSSSQQTNCNDIITKTIDSMDLILKTTKWYNSRVEIVVARKVVSDIGDDFPAVSELEKAHREIYNLFELSNPKLVEDYEIILAGPGIDDVLRSARDYLSFQGFPVIVTTNEIFKKSTRFEGTLQERNDDHVIISVKGRIIRIPVSIVEKVELPKAKFEPNDPEIKKLR